MTARRLLHARRAPAWLPAAALALIVLSGIGPTAGAQTLSSWKLWKIDADGSHLALVAPTPGYRCGSPQWSPDGTMIAFDTWRVEEPVSQSQIGVLNADGTDWRLIGPGGMPSWSPDGTQLVCHTYLNAQMSRRVVQQTPQTITMYMARSRSDQTIDVMNSDGSGRETIAEHWGSPRWSPRGDRVFSITPNGELLMLDLATGREQNVPSSRYSVRQGFSISPDGSRICFADESSGIALATLNERTMATRVRQLVRTGTCFHSSSAPDGHRVVFSWKSRDDAPEQLYVMNVDEDSEPTHLNGQDENRRNVNPAWSPDGKTIVFASEPLEQLGN